MFFSQGAEVSHKCYKGIAQSRDTNWQIFNLLYIS